MKRFISLLVITFALFLVVGCSSTSTDTVSDTTKDEEITQELIGVWTTDKDNIKTTYEFDKDGTYTKTIENNDTTDIIKGTYTEYDGDLTLMPETYNGEMETDYVSENNITEENMKEDDYVFASSEATITINGDIMKLKTGDTTLEFTKED